MAKLQIKVGFKINYLTFERQIPTIPYKRSKGLFRCDCGGETQTYISNVTTGHTKSCGCHRKKVSAELCSKLSVTHGLFIIDGEKNPLVPIWNAIKRRCNDSKNKQYNNYGGRGIKICDEWNNDFTIFYIWCIENGWEQGLQIDRENNSLGYNPNNCRFVTCKVNNRNRRDNIILTYNGVTKTLPEFAEDFNMCPKKLRQRLSRNKMTLHEALTK